MRIRGNNEDNTETPQFLIHETVDQHLLKTRKLILNGEIDDFTASFIIMHLELFSSSVEPVYLYISSPGGHLGAGCAIIDQIELSPFPVYTIVRGQANSMASIIASCGESGHRYITRNSTMMIHSITVESQVSEPIEQHTNSINYYNKFYEDLTKEIASKIKISHKQLLKLMSETHWFNAQESIDLGLVDAIWTKEQEIASNQILGDSKSEE